MRPFTLTARAVLFDMDGTLVDSTPAVERVWTVFANRFGLDVAEILTVSHGVRMTETVRRYTPAGTDVDAVVAELSAAELLDVDGITAIEGAEAFIASLPPERIAIVTSAIGELAAARLEAAGLRTPGVFVTAEHVERGKPDPLPFLTAADLLGIRADEAIVFEDAEAGIRAGRASGAQVVVVGDHSSETTVGLPRIRDYRALHSTVDHGWITVRLPG